MATLNQEELPLYSAVLNEEDEDSGLIKVSIVNDPAIESNFVALNKTTLKLSKDLDKGTVTGALLIPDKKIIRYDSDNDEYYNLVFTKETIVKLRNKFHKDQLTSKVNLEHSKDTEGIYLIESWIVESEKDKTRGMGLGDLPIGSWVATYKVENTEVLNQIKLGEFKGFSIEAYLDKTLIKMKKQPKTETPKKAVDQFETIGALPGVENGIPTSVQEMPTEMPVESDPISILNDQVKMLWNAVSDLDYKLNSAYAEIDALKSNVQLEDVTIPSEEVATEIAQEVAQEVASEVVAEVADAVAEETTQALIEVVNELKTELARLSNLDAASKVNVNASNFSEMPKHKQFIARIKNTKF